MAARPSRAGAARPLSAPHWSDTGVGVPYRHTSLKPMCDNMGRYHVPARQYYARGHDTATLECARPRGTSGTPGAPGGPPAFPTGQRPSTCASAASVSGTQNVIAIEWYIVIAVDSMGAGRCFPTLQQLYWHVHRVRMAYHEQPIHAFRWSDIPPRIAQVLLHTPMPWS